MPGLWNLCKGVFKDIFTNSTGETYDPARVVGYGVVCAGGGVTFLALAIYDTVKTGHFNYEGFGVAFAGVSAAIVAAAGGVQLKKAAEHDHPGERRDEKGGQ